MKKIPNLILTALLCCSIPVQAQLQNNTYLSRAVIANSAFAFTSVPHTGDTVTNKEMYLQKSKSQRTVGWVLLGGGVGMAIIGGSLFASNFDLFSNTNDSKAQTGGVLFVTGLTSALVSIPFFISAGHNAQKAASISFNNQPLVLPQSNGLTVKTQPAVQLKIRL